MLKTFFLLCFVTPAKVFVHVGMHGNSSARLTDKDLLKVKAGHKQR